MSLKTVIDNCTSSPCGSATPICQNALNSYRCTACPSGFTWSNNMCNAI